MGKYRGDIVDYARKAMTYPTEFGERNYASWDDREFYSHAPIGIGQHRDSELLERANWQATINYLNENYPDTEDDDWYVHRASHWAVGWVEKIMVRVFNDPDAEDKFDEDNITEMYDDLVDYISAIENYPILDETLYCEMEHSDVIADINHSEPYWAFDTDAGAIYDWLLGNDFYPENQCYSDDEIALACFMLGMVNSYEQDDANAWAESMSTKPYADQQVKRWLENFRLWCDAIVRA